MFPTAVPPHMREVLELVLGMLRTLWPNLALLFIFPYSSRFWRSIKTEYEYTAASLRSIVAIFFSYVYSATQPTVLPPATVPHA